MAPVNRVVHEDDDPITCIHVLDVIPKDGLEVSDKDGTAHVNSCPRRRRPNHRTFMFLM